MSAIDLLIGEAWDHRRNRRRRAVSLIAGAVGLLAAIIAIMLANSGGGQPGGLAAPGSSASAIGSSVELPSGAQVKAATVLADRGVDFGLIFRVRKHPLSGPGGMNVLIGSNINVSLLHPARAVVAIVDGQTVDLKQTPLPTPDPYRYVPAGYFTGEFVPSSTFFPVSHDGRHRLSGPDRVKVALTVTEEDGRQVKTHLFAGLPVRLR